MTPQEKLMDTSSIDRRRLLLGALGAGSLAAVSRVLLPQDARGAVAAADPVGTGPQKAIALAGTDGWVSMPANAPADPPFFPDPLAPSPFNTYVFGFRDVSGLSDTDLAAQRGKAQISAPILVFDEEDEITLSLYNLGLSQRPDLFDGHTMHWHGFTNAIPLFDGVPELSLSVPVGRRFDYFYKPHDAGTYMYHCHFEDVEHVQMGMTGMVWVRPKQNRTGVNGYPVGTKYAYNDGDGSTRYDREFGIILTELWSAAHYRDAHIQVSDWTDFDASFWLMNGRAYPDTLAPNGANSVARPDGGLQYRPDLDTASGRLQYQPNSSHITCVPGERVLVRLANLGFQDHSLTCDEIDLTVVAEDASLLRNGDVTNYQTTNTVNIGPGESRDLIFTAPAVGDYFLYDRRYSFQNNGGGAGYGGMMTQISVRPSLPAQTQPNL
ncbi:multicopper oxidase [Phycicoccus duodecadis]|uniref:Multicopper oxidase n=2 Tax=Phycicoccus duodecadis TaxID=173053 RepID=A0A2N3YF53_9MICO|nr:multicopper oxidase [Phycicoccus duodecadis]